METAGHALAEFRRARRISQLDLSLEAGVSSRHISFIETGRTQPSRQLLLRLSEALGLTHRDCNRLMMACGYTPLYTEMTLDDAAMEPVRKALNIMLDNQDPFPCAVLNSQWELQMANHSLEYLLGALIPKGRFKSPINMLEIIFDPEGLRPYMTNWSEVASLLLRRLKQQLQTQPRPEIATLMDALLSMNPPQGWQTPEPEAMEGPMLTSELAIQGQSLRVFSTLTSFGTSLDAGLQELMIESWFPADEETRGFFESMAEQVL